MKTEGETELYFIFLSQEKSKVAAIQTILGLDQTMPNRTSPHNCLEVQGIGKPSALYAKLCEHVHFLGFIAGTRFSHRQLPVTGVVPSSRAENHGPPFKLALVVT